MISKRKGISVLVLIIVFYAISLWFFYLKYVPLVKPFQQILIPILLFVLVLTLVNFQSGTLFFILAFPLLNCLPYFFDIFENTPHAPTALVLFLFYFLGFLLYTLFHRSKISFKGSIFQPLVLFSITIFLSGIITFLRYSNFYPFLSDRIYELTTSVYGVTAGGAIMSVLFFSLNYLTGPAFFLIFLKAARSRAFLTKALAVFSLSTLISLGFGLFQHMKNIKIGSSPLTFNQGLINATFKDALSFGAFIAMAVPLTLGVCFGGRGLSRLFSFFLVVFSLFMLFFSGSKSALLGTAIALILFSIFSLIMIVNAMKAKLISFKRMNWASYLIILSVVIALFYGTIISQSWQKEFSFSQTILRAKQSIIDAKSAFKRGNLESIFWGRTDKLWKMAIPIIRDYPVSGVGIGGYIIEVSNYSRTYSTAVDPESAENYILQVASELGLVGVILVFWILWEISKQIRRSYRKIPPTDNYKFILIGAIAGIISFLLMIQTHTFIGSYEIKYTFWLLVGIVFCLGRTAEGKEEGDKQNPLFNKTQKIVSFVILSLFSAVNLWNSTHSLSLKSRTELLGIKQDFGFYQFEKTDDGREFRWTREYGGLTVKIERPVIGIPLLASHPDIQQRPVKVEIYLVKDFFKHKKLLAELTLNQSVWKTYDYEVPEEVGQELILLVKVNRTWNPLRILGTPDPRNLGVAMGKIEFKDKTDS